MDIPELRPLTLGELLDRTFTYYRRHFWLFVGIMAIPQVLIVAVGVISQALQGMAAGSAGTTVPSSLRVGMIVGAVLGALVLLAVYFVLYTLALGATAFAVSEIHLGRRTTARAAYRSMRGRFWRITDLIVTVAVRMFLIFVLSMALPMFFPLFLDATSGVVVALLVLLLVIVYAGGMVYAIRLILSYACSVPALLLENLKATAAIKRSVALTKKNLGRVFLIVLLMTIIAWTAVALFQGPFYIAIFVLAVKANTPPPVGLTIGMNIAGGVGQALTGPLLMIGLVLLYYDIRVRKEGFDLQLMLSAVDAQSPQLVVTPVQRAAESLQLEKTSVMLVILLSIGTFGLYQPIWYIRRREAINSLRSREKISDASSFVVWGVLLASVSLGFLVGAWQSMRLELDTAPLLSLSQALSLAAVVILIFKAFKVRRILEDHMSASRAAPFSSGIALLHDSSLSGVATFFFGIYYLQYKINQIVDGWMSPGAALVTEPAPAAPAVPLS